MESSQILATARPIEYLVFGISSTSAIITRFIRSVRVAHADLSAVTRELSDLRLLLDLLKDEPGMPLLLQAQMLSVLESCGNVLIEIDAVLARHPNIAQWLASGRSEMAACRLRLTTFREALALALEVASLTNLYGSATNPDAARDSITSEVQRLQANVQCAGPYNNNVASTLVPYLDAVSSCVLSSPVEDRAGYQGGDGTIEYESDPPQSHRTPLTKRRTTITQSFDNENTGLEDGVISIGLGQGIYPPPSAPYPFFDSSKRYGAGDRVHAAQNNALTYSREESEQVTALPPTGAFPESPTLPALPNPAQPVPQRSLPQSLVQSAWKQSGSGSTKSEPSGSVTYADPELPSPPRERYSDPIHNPSNWSPFRDHSISPPSSSFKPIDSPRSSITSIPRESSTTSPFFDIRSGSVSPGRSSPGLSIPVPLAPFPYTPPPFSPPPEYHRTPTPKSPHRRTETIASASQITIPSPAKHSPHQSRVEITPARHLTDKGKGADILHIDTSPNSVYTATRHNKVVKIWSIPKNALHGTIKITSYVQPKVRSREYFIRSHAILSEAATLIGITTHFGLTLEIYNFSKGGSGAKKVQVIDDAHRWAASQRDAHHSEFAPLAIYRPKGDRIDRFSLSHDPNTKKPFVEDPAQSIELLKSDLPFLPKFPELAFSSDSPFLIAAAGPRPGDPMHHASANANVNATVNANANTATATILLVAWLLKPYSPPAHMGGGGGGDETRHRPYRVHVPPAAAHPALQSALPSHLAAHGSVAVSIWIPAPAKAEAADPVPRPAPERLVLVWDLPANASRVFAIPNVQACCIAPDCRRVAYCDAARGEFVIVDVQSQEEVWRWPEVVRKEGFASFGQLEGGLKAVTVFEFSRDGRLLVVGDSGGGVGVYEVKEEGPRFELAAGNGSDVLAAGGRLTGSKGVGSVALRELPT
ncbi:hypothetical protein MFIFM68171_07988 [Madurella fahalii]|uniref:Uncharacterized protein n=1 Tax=Madurella fahalii TaxID=1157608 RepID=A0ABQ0GJ41_9PEZI